MRAQRLGARDPEDLAQEALRRTLAASALAEGDTLGQRKYAFRVLHNLFVDEKRKARRELFSDAFGEPVDVASDEPTDPEFQVAERQLLTHRRRAAEEALKALEEQERTFLLRAITLQSAPAAQRELGYPPGTPANACQRRNVLLKRVQRALRRPRDR